KWLPNDVGSGTTRASPTIPATDAASNAGHNHHRRQVRGVNVAASAMKPSAPTMEGSGPVMSESASNTVVSVLLGNDHTAAFAKCVRGRRALWCDARAHDVLTIIRESFVAGASRAGCTARRYVIGARCRARYAPGRG